MKQDPRDWHPAEIKAAVWKQGLTFKGLAMAHGYKSIDAISQALHRSYPKAERILAEAVGVPPEVIWPSRYRARMAEKSVSNKTDSSKSRVRAHDLARVNAELVA